MALVCFVIALPTLVLHELAHYVAVLPWGGPDGVYLIYDTSKPGLAGRVPIGAAVYHTRIDEQYHPIAAMAPLGYLVPMSLITPTTGSGLVAWAAVSLAGLVTVLDGVKLISPRLYRRLLDRDCQHEFRLFMDLAGWRGDPSPSTMRRDQ